MEQSELIAWDGEPFIPHWVVPCWPKIKPLLLERLMTLPEVDRAAIVAAVNQAPGALAFREIDGYVYVGAGTDASGYVVLELPLVDVLPAAAGVH